MKIKKLIYLSIAVAVSLASCKKDDPVPPVPPQSNVVIVDCHIFESRTWYSDSIYVVPNIVKIDALLTIQAGTIIKFYGMGSLKLWDAGTINAIGSDDSQILFTSIKDDTGGDTNNDLAGTTPNSGDWEFVDLANQNGSQFKYCRFLYGGNNNYSGVLELGYNYSKVEYCLFADNISTVTADVYYGALSANDADPATIIKNNTFYNNTVPLSINGHFSIDNSNIFSNPDDPDQTNTYNGIFVYGQDIISHNPIWEETEVAYVIQYNGFEIWDNFSLSLGDNVVLKFFTDAMFDIQIGAGLINNQGAGVFFTSFKDDGHKGDTNGDADATSPTSEEWLGIYNNQEFNYFYTWSNILYSKNDF